ncbi:MAG: ISC system 2Fe-2S type ferredoxin [SAR86 cluster bacterium]|jgi:ferredoxin, 2Fe-2S|nr:ISC system 2Fe-2S type ferredoxin [SAR86 cluster bacterium]|tara:strand:+ start:3267 stop:3605 length:339 start_codon:yes stop_codon:yes gene_type:complete
MTKVRILPHKEACPNGMELEVKDGDSLCEALLKSDVPIEHACELSCACTTCHVIVRKGFHSLEEASDKEEDMLDKAWGLEPNSRLSCQLIVKDEELEIELPKYTINMVSETN